MNHFNSSNLEEKKKYRRLKGYWKLLLKDSATLDDSNMSYHYLFKRHLYVQDIIGELLHYDKKLQNAYEVVQLLHYHRKKRILLLETLSKQLP